MGCFRALQPTLGLPDRMVRKAPGPQVRQQAFRPRQRCLFTRAQYRGCSGWASLNGTRPGLVHGFGRHVSTFLHPFAPPALPGFFTTMGALTPGRSALRSQTRREHRLWHRPGLSVSRAWSSEPSVSNHLTAPIVALSPNPSARWASRLWRVRVSSFPSRLTGQPGRIEFVNLRTTRSPPVALHPASRRRSYDQLQAGVGMPEEDLHLSGQTRLRTH
jgi:hypothetical protein